MFLSVIFNFITIITLLGYAFFVKKILTQSNNYKSYNFKVENLDIFYGFIFLIFVSLFVNFFFPLKYFTAAVILVGLSFFIHGLYKKFFNLNFALYFCIIFFISFISFYSKDNVDSPMYHLQIIKWMVHNKISFGIANLEVRLGHNSSWHSFVALFDLNFKNFSNKFYISSVFFSFIIYEFLQNKKKCNYSDYFLCLVICYLFLFSYLHPYYYGVVLNHLGNPEKDIVSMLQYFFVIYLFMKINENKNYPNLLVYEKKNLVNIFFISIFLCITTRITTLPILILFFYVFFNIKNFNRINCINIFILIVGFFWIIRSFILSGCFIFPITQSCVPTFWSTNIETVKFLVEEAMRYSRTLPSLERVHDFNFTLNSYDWLLPWFKNYFFEAALLQIGLYLIIFLILLILLKFLHNKINKKNTVKVFNYEYIVLLTLVSHIFFWFKAPEIRYAWGLLFSLPVFFVVIFMKFFSINNVLINHKHLASAFLFIFALFFSKSLKNFNFEDLYKISERRYDFSKIQKIGTFNGIDIYFNYWKCADYKNVCVNIPRKDYKISKKFSYFFYENY